MGRIHLKAGNYSSPAPSVGAVSVANCAHVGPCLALEAGHGQIAKNQGSEHGASELDRHRRGTMFRSEW
jgi:hypothetical protein